jgi:hypothetical protein
MRGLLYAGCGRRRGEGYSGMRGGWGYGKLVGVGLPAVGRRVPYICQWVAAFALRRYRMRLLLDTVPRYGVDVIAA